MKNPKPKIRNSKSRLKNKRSLVLIHGFGSGRLTLEPSRGYAAITLTLLTLLVSLSIISAFTFFSLKEVSINRNFTKSMEAKYFSEGGIEDALYRVISGKQFLSPETLNVGSGSAKVSIVTDGNQRVIRSEGLKEKYQRNIESVVDVTADSVNFFYGVQVGAGGLTMGNNSIINGNVYSNGSIVGNNGSTVNGDAVVAGGVSDTPTFEWPTQNVDQIFATSSSNRDIAQSFVATAGGSVPKISVYLAKVGTPSANLSVHIATDNGGKPSTSALASGSVSPSTVGLVPSWIDLSFSNAPTLTNGTKYWIVLDYDSNSTTSYWNWRKDDTDGYANNTGKTTSSWSSGGSSWTNVNGDLAFRVWIGGTNTRIDGVTIGNSGLGSGRANLFLNANIHGSDCPNQYCVIDNPPIENLPLSSGVIQDWKNDAAAGGTCAPPQCDSSGNLTVSGTVSIGPQKISGNLTVSNGATLVVTGTLWVTGDISMSNGCLVKLGSSYGGLSGVIVGDDDISVSNNCTFQGSGVQGSSIMLLSDKNTPTSDVITVNNNSLGVIFYASRGKIHFSNNATAKEATGYGIVLDNGAAVTYESGLANLQFSSGPSGGYDVKYWKEVE